MKKGLLLINLGTPTAPTAEAVRPFLREFLSDPRVLTMPAVARWLLLNVAILPFRPAKSAEAYKQIWTDEGSPLLVHSEALVRAVQEALGEQWQVRLGMRYGEPSLAGALDGFQADGIDDVLVFPLYPQYASSSTGTTLELLYRLAGTRPVPMRLHMVLDFYDDPAFIDALVDVARPVLDDFEPDHVLFSYHGLPVSHVKASELGTPCKVDATCCAQIGPGNRACYRAHCFATTRALVPALGIGGHTTSFQSRLGREPWIRPFTDEVLVTLAREGVRRLAVLCPSFTADCLETNEEMGIRGRASFLEAGGEDYCLVPCVNSHPTWVRGVADIARARAPR